MRVNDSFDIFPALSSDANTAAIRVDWLLIEEMGRRDVTIVARHLLRYVVQFMGCKTTKWISTVTRLLDELMASAVSSWVPALPPSTSSRGAGGTGTVDSLPRRSPPPVPSSGFHSRRNPEAIPQSLPSPPAQLLAADAEITVREQWSRRTLRKLASFAEAEAVSADPEAVLVMLVPKALFVQCLSNVLATVLRDEFRTAHIYRRISVTLKIVRRQQPLVILCGGTSGCGKSTLANLMAAKLGIATVVSTDAIREMLRKHRTEAQCPELFASTYQAHERINETNPAYANLSETDRVLRAYEAQSRHVLEVLDRLVDGFIHRSEPVVVEGVHLLATYMLEKARSLAFFDVPVIPVLVTIKNEAKHKERLAIRSKSMTLMPEKNKYVRHFNNIRAIQNHLLDMVKGVDEFYVVNNTNVDRSVSSIHAYLLACLENFQTFSSGSSGGYLAPATGRNAIKGKVALEKIKQRREEKRGQRARSALADSRPSIMARQLHREVVGDRLGAGGSGSPTQSSSGHGRKSGGGGAVSSPTLGPSNRSPRQQFPPTLTDGLRRGAASTSAKGPRASLDGSDDVHDEECPSIMGS